MSFIALDTNYGRHSETYIPLCGAFLSLVSMVIYPWAMFWGRSWAGLLMALSGFVPYLLGLFVFIVMGGGRLYGLLSGFSLGGLLGGVFWLVIGYWILYWFWLYTEAVTRMEKARKQALATFAAAQESPGAPKSS